MLSFKEFINEEKINLNMSWRDIHKNLGSKGWELVRTSGEHDIFAHKNSTLKVSVPKFHKGSIPAGTVRQILRKSTTFDKQ